MVCVMRGHSTTLAVLAWHGADLTKVCATQETPAAVARARGDEGVLSVLQLCCVPEAPEPITMDNDRHVAEVGEFTLIPCGADGHEEMPGACFVDGAFDKRFLQRLESVWHNLPSQVESMDGKDRGRGFAQTCARRSLFCDVTGWIGPVLQRVAAKALERDLAAVHVLPRMRFLCYPETGGSMQPHVDLSKRDFDQGRALSSTHTFILHLRDCDAGGETVFLESLTGTGLNVVRAAVAPRRGRLLVFPHGYPHAGLLTLSPKVFLRGEMLVV
jgi:hypothetical protein